MGFSPLLSEPQQFFPGVFLAKGVQEPEQPVKSVTVELTLPALSSTLWERKFSLASVEAIVYTSLCSVIQSAVLKSDILPRTMRKCREIPVAQTDPLSLYLGNADSTAIRPQPNPFFIWSDLMPHNPDEGQSRLDVYNWLPSSADYQSFPNATYCFLLFTKDRFAGDDPTSDFLDGVACW